jgi:hypothetical protein
MRITLALVAIAALGFAGCCGGTPQYGNACKPVACAPAPYVSGPMYTRSPSSSVAGPDAGRAPRAPVARSLPAVPAAPAMPAKAARPAPTMTLTSAPAPRTVTPTVKTGPAGVVHPCGLPPIRPPCLMGCCAIPASECECANGCCGIPDPCPNGCCGIPPAP